MPQSPLPAPLSARRSLLRSPLRSCPLLAKMENAPSASTRRWTRSSTPAATCACATTAGWSSRGRSTRAVPSAGGPSRTSSRRIGRDGPHASSYCVLRAVVFSTSGWVGLGNLSGDEPNSDIMVPIFFFFRICFLEVGKFFIKDSPGGDPSCCTKTANTSSFILTREIREGLWASILSMWCLFLMSRVFTELTGRGWGGAESQPCTFCLFSLTVLFDLRNVLQPSVVDGARAQCLRSVALCLHGYSPSAAIFLHVHIQTRQNVDAESVAASGRGARPVRWSD